MTREDWKFAADRLVVIFVAFLICGSVKYAIDTWASAHVEAAQVSADAKRP